MYPGASKGDWDRCIQGQVGETGLGVSRGKLLQSHFTKI